MLDVISLFREQGTVDELGLGVLRDAFADQLFPATSLVMTRARYFLFVPWIYRRLEDERVPSGEIERKGRRAEIKLIDPLLEAGDIEGVIGRVARDSLQRLPSNIYWNGLRSLRICLFDGSRDMYHQSLDRYYVRRRGAVRSDDGDALSGIGPNWDPNLPEAPKDFPDRASLRLEKREAEYLRDRILLTAPESLLAHLVTSARPGDTAEFPWEHPGYASFSVLNKRRLRHAQNLSEVMHGAALLYNLMLARLTQSDERIAEYEQQLGEWADLIDARVDGLRGVARGLVARVVDHLWDDVPRIDVVYICSNSSIARQNVNRLNITETKEASLPSRITLLPKVVRGLKQRKLNFISLTPQTSFDLRSSLGKGEERALLYWLLPDDWKTSSTAAQNALQGGVDRDNFRAMVAEVKAEDIDKDLLEAFHAQVARHPELLAQFRQLCERFAYSRLNIPDEDRSLQKEVVGRLRLELAVSCLGALEPDLIILDEFQRFKHLLDGTDQSSELARELFAFPDARVLLLSATPYKMYTLSDEAATEDHFRDFNQTLAFLHNDATKSEHVRSLLADYRTEIVRLTSGNDGSLRQRKRELERALRDVMVRTERLAVTADRNGMLVEVPSSTMTLGATDLASYVGLARVAKAVEHHDVLEYWKSAPYLLNFMDDYQLKTAFEHAAGQPASASKLTEALGASPEALLNWEDVEAYRKLDPGNARVRALLSDVLEPGAWRLLWLPPSLPHYQLDSAFTDAAARGLTKRLVFSSWQVVPKVVAALLSYEAERLMFGPMDAEQRANTPEARERRKPLLRLSRSEGRLTGMPILGLLYPSITLAAVGDPVEFARRQEGSARVSVQEVLDLVAQELGHKLSSLRVELRDTPTPDERWYWAAPILLDLHAYPEAARAWLLQENLSEAWRSEEGEGEPRDADQEAEQETREAWPAHVDEARRLIAGRTVFGAQPPDLAAVLSHLAIAGPAVSALRALSRISGGREALVHPALRNRAGWVAWGFRTLFNLPEVTAMIRARNAEEPYWLRVLEYCAGGGLQAVLDEYVHVMLECEGLQHKPPAAATRAVASRIASALQFRTANMGVDAITVDPQRRSIELADKRMRARFAARFGARQTDDDAAAVRQDDLRSAFNSPFWPFVLCSTSVGQEGLDFHLYCHAVVHWNLPSNPVDLEQREGRVHRYKGHAVRKNVAQAYGAEALRSDDPDAWGHLFDLASQGRLTTASDLVPFWVFPTENGARIERHVPALPLSRDLERADILRRALTVYRMAFGQNRQEDLVAYLQQQVPADQIERVSEDLRIDLSPPAVAQQDGSIEAPLRASARPAWTWHPGEVSRSDGEVSDILPLFATVETLRELLDEFARLRSAGRPDNAVVRFRDVLDRYAAARQRGLSRREPS